MRTPKRFSISKCLLRRRAMLDARFWQIGQTYFYQRLLHIAARFVCDSWPTCLKNAKRLFSL